jgi:hypothetical protein
MSLGLENLNRKIRLVGMKEVDGYGRSTEIEDQRAGASIKRMQEAKTKHVKQALKQVNGKGKVEDTNRRIDAR